MKEKIQRIEISHKTIIFVVLFILSLWFLYKIKDILLLLFFSLVLMGAINPTISRLEKLKIPRWLSILAIYLLIISLFSLAIIGIVPPLVEQTKELINLIPSFLTQFHPLGLTPEFISSQINGIGNIPGEILKLFVAIVSNAFSILVILVITLYLLIEHRKLDKHLSFLFGSERAEKVRRIIFNLETRLGGWIRAEFFLMTIIGILSYIGFRMLGLDFALPLALIAGLLEIVPNIGPVAASIPAILVGLMVSPLTGLATGAWCFLIQQFENNLIVPSVMKKTVGVSPLITIFGLAIGFKIAGVLGAILAVPTYLMIETLLIEFLPTFSSKKKVSANE